MKHEVLLVDISDNAVSQQLFESFMRVRKLNWLNWHGDGPKPSDVRALFCIKRESDSSSHAGHAGATVSEISSRLRVTSPTVTQLVNDMELRGLVYREPDTNDRRVIRVQLTEMGNAAWESARSSVTDAFNGLIDYLGPEQSQQLAELMGRVLVYYNDHQNVTTPWGSL